MTPQSIAIAMAVTLFTGLLGGWLFRENTALRHWSVAAAIAMGLLLFRTSGVADLFGNLIPASALGWVPWIALLIAGVQVTTDRRVRIAGALALGFAIPLRLLWGSVYLSKANPSPAVLIAIVAWSLAISFAIGSNKPAVKGRFSIPVFGWAMLIASGTCVVATTGSITYAVAIGIVGVAVVGGLVGASRLPLQGATVVICIIGLSVAFSEMPLPLGMLLIVAALVVSTMGQETVSPAKWSKPIQFSAHAAMVFVAAFAISKGIAPSDEYGGYESDAQPFADNSVVDNSGADDAFAGDIAPAQRSLQNDASSGSPADDATDQESMPDPFAGFEP